MAVSPEDQALAAVALAEGLQPDAPIGFAVHDDQLRFRLVSRSLAAMNGRPLADHLGRRVGEMLPPGLAEAVEAVLAEVRDTGAARTGVEIDGSTYATPGDRRSWAAGYYPVKLGQRPHVGVVLVDVTERHRAEAALRESEAELSGAQRMAGVGWWTWTAETETVVYAPELLALLGHDPALGGAPHGRELVLADGELASVREAAEASLADGRPFARRVRARHADGRIRLLEARADVVCDAAGRPVGLRGFAQDVTELASAEQRQRIITELGQRALEEDDLDALLRHAADVVDREVGPDGAAVLEALRGGAPARVRAPSSAGPPQAPVIPVEPGDRFGEEDTAFLVAIANVLADAVERRAAQEEIAAISAARGRLVARVIEAEDRARRGISDALHDGALQELLAARAQLFAMAGRGGDDTAVEAIQARLAEIVGRLRDVMSALHPTLLQYGGLEAALAAVVEQERGTGAFEARVSVAPDASSDRDELVLSVARELLANAARHAGAGRVEVAVRREPDAILLRVTDDGSGIAPGRLEAALEAGAIGIASCRERVEALGGSLRLRTAPGAGTEVIARIPHGVEGSGISCIGNQGHGA